MLHAAVHKFHFVRMIIRVAIVAIRALYIFVVLVKQNYRNVCGASIMGRGGPGISGRSAFYISVCRSAFCISFLIFYVQNYARIEENSFKIDFRHGE